MYLENTRRDWKSSNSKGDQNFLDSFGFFRIWNMKYKILNIINHKIYLNS